MSKVNVFRSAFDNKFETLFFDLPVAVKDIGISIDFDNAAIFVNGRKVDKEYVLKDDEFCTIKALPSGGDSISNTFDIAMTVLTGGAYGVYWGITDAVNGKTLGQHISDNIKDAFRDMFSSESSDTPDVKQIPCIAGGKNQSQLNNAFPFFLGKHFYTPMYIGAPYTTISGEDGEEQYFHALYLLGYNSITIKDIKLGVLDLASNIAGVENGTIAVDGKLLDGSEYDAELEIRQESSEVSLYPQKVVEETSNIQLVNIEDKGILQVPRFSAKNPQRIEIQIQFNGLYALNDDGKTTEDTVKVKAEISLDKGKTWKPFAEFSGCASYDTETGESTFKKNKQKIVRYVASKTLSYSDAINCSDRIAELRISRTTEESTDGKHCNTVYLTHVRTWCYDYTASKAAGRLVAQVPIIEKYRDRTARLGFKIKSADRLTGTLDELNFIGTSKCRTWDSSAKKWSSSVSATSNPAAVAMNLLQSAMLADKKYNDAKLDVDSFGEFYEFCAANGYECNGVLSKQTKLADVLNSILLTGHGYRVLNNNKYGVFIDRNIETPVMILNNQNVLNAKNSKDFPEEYDGYKVTFINENNGYVQDEMQVLFDDAMANEANLVLKPLNLAYITKPTYVYKMAKYNLAISKLRPETWIRTVSLEGKILDIGSLVELQDDTILVGIGNGAEIKKVVAENGFVIGIETDGEFNVADASIKYAVKIQQADGVNAPKIVTKTVVIKSAGIYTDFVFEEPIRESTIIPYEGDIVSFGVYQKVTTDAIVMGKKDNGDDTYELSLVPYDERIYNAENGEIPEFDSKTTPPKLSAEVSSSQPTVSFEQFDNLNNRVDGIFSNESPDVISGVSAIAGRDSITVSWSKLESKLANKIRIYRIEMSRDGGSSWDAFSTATDEYIYVFDRKRDGYPEKENFNDFRFRVKAENIYGNVSKEWSEEVSVDVSQYGTWKAPIFGSMVSPVAGRDSIVLMERNADAPASEYYAAPFVAEYQMARDGDFDGASVRTFMGESYQFSRTEDGYPEKGDLEMYRVRGRFKSQSYSSSVGEWGEPSSVNTSEYGTWIPAAPDKISAKATSTNIIFSSDGGLNPEVYYGSPFRLEWEVCKNFKTYDKATGIWSENPSPDWEQAGSQYYWFIRDSDDGTENEYPERDELDNAWRIRARYASSYGMHGEYSLIQLDTSAYLTWKLPEITVSASAYERRVVVSWGMSESYYGIPSYTIVVKRNVGGAEQELVRKSLNTSMYTYLFSEFLEKDDFVDFSFEVHARTEADARSARCDSVDTSGYLTYKITPPQVAVKADESGLHVSWTGKTDAYYLYPVYDVLVGGVKVAEGLEALSLDVPYPEDAPYPRKAAVEAVEVVVVARTEADEVQSEAAHPDVSEFKGWVPSVPRLYITASGRTVPLSWDVQDVWGWTGADVQVAAAYKVEGGRYVPITDASELEWYAPALGKNPYESLDNYRHGDADGWLSVDGTSVAFTVPLWGQQADESGSIMGAVNTLYAYRVRGVSIAEKSAWSEPYYAEARATSAYDVVKAWDLNDNGEKVKIDGALGVQQIFVEELAALSANLGLITDGGLFGGQYNYWAVNDTPMPDGSTLWKGSFRVGDETQYIKATPILDASGNPTGRIDLEFRAGQFMINATGTRIDGKSFEVYDADGNLMFAVSPDGSKIRVKEGEYTPSDVATNSVPMYAPYGPLQVVFDNNIYLIGMGRYTDDDPSNMYTSIDIYKVSGSNFGAAEPYMTIKGFYSYFIYILRSATASNGRLWIPSALVPLNSAEATEDDFLFGNLEIDLEAKTYNFHENRYDIFDSEGDENGVVWNITEADFIGDCIFMFAQGTLYKDGVSSYHNTIFMLDKYGVKTQLVPDLEVDNDWMIFGPPVTHDGYIYCPWTSVDNLSSYFMIMRRNLSTGRSEYCAMPAAVMEYFSPSATMSDTRGPFVVIDDDSIYAHGLILALAHNESIGYWGFGLMQIPHLVIRWNPVDDPTDLTLYMDPVMTTGYKLYKGKYSYPIPVEEYVNFMLPAFGCNDGVFWTATGYDSGGAQGEVKVCKCKLVDFDAPEEFDFFTLQGKVQETDIKTLDFPDSSVPEKDRVPFILFCMFIGRVFPSIAPKQEGFHFSSIAGLVDTAQDDYSIPYGMLLSFFKEEYRVLSGSNVYTAGIGFNEIYFDTTSKRYRYYLDTGAWLEFREDGSLVAQGEKGDAGPQGATGAQGPKGDTGATPAISMTATVDNGVGEPSVDVSKSGTAAAPEFSLAFKNLKGDKGDKGDTGAQGAQGEKGDKGDPGELTAESAVAADVADANYAVGIKASGEVTKTLWSAVWTWIKSKIESVAHSPLITSLKYNTGSQSGTCLSVEKLTTTGSKLVIGAAGNTHVGGGESAQTIAATVTTETEILYLSSDENVRIITGVQEGVANAKTTEFRDDGSTSFPGAIDITNATTSNSTTPVKAIGGQMASNDLWRIAAGGTSNNGFVELATADDGTEPIYIRQYSGVFATPVRTLTLLDGSGNTSFPGKVSAAAFKIPTSQPSALEDGMIWLA